MAIRATPSTLLLACLFWRCAMSEQNLSLMDGLESQHGYRFRHTDAKVPNGLCLDNLDARLASIHVLASLLLGDLDTAECNPDYKPLSNPVRMGLARAVMQLSEDGTSEIEKAMQRHREASHG